MPKTLSKKDPNLIEGVNRLKRVQRIWGLLLTGLGVLTEWVGAGNHPVAGLPLLAVGAFALVWTEPAVLAAVAVAVAFSMAPTVNPRLTIQPIPDVAISEDTPSTPIPVLIRNVQNTADPLPVTVASSNPALAPTKKATEVRRNPWTQARLSSCLD